MATIQDDLLECLSGKSSLMIENGITIWITLDKILRTRFVIISSLIVV